jgi:hypothetical protein
VAVVPVPGALPPPQAVSEAAATAVNASRAWESFMRSGFLVRWGRCDEL